MNHPVADTTTFPGPWTWLHKWLCPRLFSVMGWSSRSRRPADRRYSPRL